MRHHENSSAIRIAAYPPRRSTSLSACLRLVFIGLVAHGASACSVGLALDGEKQPDLSVLKVGAEKATIERELGPPKGEAQLADGRTQSTYVYEVGNEPSAGRAAVHAGMDVLTLGLWEVVGTPLEATQGNEMRLVVTYDAARRAESFDIKELDDETAAASPPGPAGGGSAR